MMIDFKCCFVMCTQPYIYFMITVVRPLLISSCIYPENGRSETLCKSIIATMIEKQKLLDSWRSLHEDRFGTDTHDIPASSELCFSKLNNGGTMTDTCNAARKFNAKIAEHIRDVCKQKAIESGIEPSEANVRIQQQDCHNHLRNVWIGAITKRLSEYLNDLLACDLEAIHFRYRVTTMIDAVLRAVDKEFSLPANYPKGHGQQFRHWLKLHHPGVLLVPVQRTSGSRQDLAVEGAAAVYWNRKYYVEFLDEELKCGKDSILQENLFMVLTSMDMVALSRLFSILHFTVCMPMRFLAGQTHSIGALGYDWSPLSMGKAIDAIENAMMEIQSDGSKIMDEGFMGSIFEKINDNGPLEPLKEFMTYMFGE